MRQVLEAAGYGKIAQVFEKEFRSEIVDETKKLSPLPTRFSALPASAPVKVRFPRARECRARRAGRLRTLYNTDRWNRPIPVSASSPVAVNKMLEGSGTAVPFTEKAALNATPPPTMSVPTRSQSGSRLVSRVHACRSVTPLGNGVVPAPLIGLDAESQ
jgi:hypothetical protein